MHFIQDPHFVCDTISCTPNPQFTSYLAAHQDYSEDYVMAESHTSITEKLAGRIVVDRCLRFGHFGVVEHPQIVLNFGYFPHSVMQQVRTHRTGISFDVQSFRFSGKRFVKWVESDTTLEGLEKLVYFRPVGRYRDRQGKDYEYTGKMRHEDLTKAAELAELYVKRIKQGVSEEHARGNISFDVRQHFVMSCNLRCALHLLNVRYKSDVQPECQTWADFLWKKIQEWTPEIAEFYDARLLGKVKLTA